MVYEKTRINNIYEIINPNTKFKIKYDDKDIGQKISDVIGNYTSYDGDNIRNIDIDEFNQELINTYETYNNSLDIIKSSMMHLSKNNNNQIDAIVKDLNVSNNNFNQNNGKIFFGKKLVDTIKLTMNEILTKQLENANLSQKMVNYNEFIENVPVFNTALNREIGSYNINNPKTNVIFSNVIEQINNRNRFKNDTSDKLLFKFCIEPC